MMEKSKNINPDTTIYSLESGTCTDRAVKHFLKINNLPELNVVYQVTFNECIRRAKEHKGSIVVLPHIHSLCQDLEYSNEWVSLKEHLFLLKNPPLYLVKGIADNNTTSVLPTLKQLLDEKDLELVDADNTQDAARKVAEGKSGYGVTNEAGQQKYGLEIVKKLKEIDMVWTPFMYVGK